MFKFYYLTVYKNNFNYHRCFCVKTLFWLTEFHCSQINLRADLPSLKKALRIGYLRILKKLPVKTIQNKIVVAHQTAILKYDVWTIC